jgi:hypothetical protein
LERERESEEGFSPMPRPRKYPPELLDRGARLVFESGCLRAPRLVRSGRSTKDYVRNNWRPRAHLGQRGRAGVRQDTPRGVRGWVSVVGVRARSLFLHLVGPPGARSRYVSPAVRSAGIARGEVGDRGASDELVFNERALEMSEEPVLLCSG